MKILREHRKNTAVPSRKEIIRMKFWAWMYEKHPKMFRWCSKYLPFDTLPF